MKFVFRADASTQIGSGHVMRCATLAEYVRELGAETYFICRELPGDYREWLQSNGHSVISLPASQNRGLESQNDYLSWLGVAPAVELDEALTALAGIGNIDWLIVDHYALDASWEKSCSKLVKHIMCIDDLANRSHDCDLLLDQNYYGQMDRRYADLLSKKTSGLYGPSYALLRREFRIWRSKVLPRSGAVNSILVFLGGVDSGNVTSTVLRAWDRCKSRYSAKLDVVVGGGNPHLEEVEFLCSRAGAVLHRQCNYIAQLMASADFAIGAAGAATWERAALGLPTLAVTVAENQDEIARCADAIGILQSLGSAALLSEAEWTAAIDSALSHPERLREQSKMGMLTVDTLGVQRVVEKMRECNGRLL